MDHIPSKPGQHATGVAESPPNGAHNGSNSSATLPDAAQAGPSRRVLRARPSTAGLSSSPAASPAVRVKGMRQATQKEMEDVQRRLGGESLSTKRQQTLSAREQQLQALLEEHDAAIREQFHLERFVTMITGWNPELAKLDNSPVFTEWKNAKHNLLELIPQNAEAGPSKLTPTAPTRTTRHRAQEKAGQLASVVSVAPPPTAHPHSVNSADAVPAKGKGKARAIQPELLNGHGNLSTSPAPSSHSGKGRRVTIAPVVDETRSELDSTEEATISSTGKRRGRSSLPNLPASKRARVVVLADEDRPSSATPSSPAVEETPVESDPAREPTPPPLPSLAHIPFPPPPRREYERTRGPRTAWYTDPPQLPPPNPPFHGDVSSFLSSYIHLEDTGPSPSLESLKQRALKEAYVLNRVAYLQSIGRLQRLQDEAGALKNKSGQKAGVSLLRQTDHQDHLTAHMVQVRNAVMTEAKNKPVICKRIARAIQTYWERIEGKEERERLAEEKERKRRMKELLRVYKKRWSLAVKVVRARLLELQRQEQDRLGKEHLQNMLQRSTGLLDAQREEMLGEFEDEEDEDTGSEGTDEVSAAEESEIEDGDDSDTGRSASESQKMTHHRGADSEAASDNEGSDVDSEDKDGSNEDDEGDTDSQADLRFLISRDETEMEVSEDAAQPSVVELSESLPVAQDALEISPLGPSIHDVLPDFDSPSPKKLHAFEHAFEHAEKDAPSVAAKSPPTEILPLNPTDSTNVAKFDTSTVIQPSFPRPRRARKSTSVASFASREDPDANDIEYAEETSDIDAQDLDLDVEMEEAESSNDDNSEDAGLLADADVPIEELLKRYGYAEPNAERNDATDEKPEVVSNELFLEVNGNLPNGDDDVNDKSLTDEALALKSTSPALIVEGKRQRRARTVWSPPETPQHLAKNPKIQVLDEAESDPEPTPSMTSEEEVTDEEEEEELDAETLKKRQEEANRVRQPFLLRGTLRPYQQAGLEWLASLYANKMNGILADEMGLGKTIQTIALLAHLACDKGVWGQHLIIVPTSVILNWEMEFKKFFPGMKVLTYYGDQKERKAKRVGWHTENAWQVCITSYQIVLADQHIFRRKNWVYMILDEAHNIKNFRSQRWQTLLGFKAQRRLLLTGTPLQNNLMELWSLLYFLMPNGVTADATAVVGFANHKEFMEWFSNPMDKAIETGDTLDEDTLATVAKLHTLLRPFILRRLKSEVETQLPGKFEHVVYCKLSKRQRFLYDEFMSRASTKEALTSGGYLGVVNTLMQLRKVCNHPDLFEVRPVRTSFAMERSVLADFEPADLLVRRRLLVRSDELDMEDFLVGTREDESGWVCRARAQLDASLRLPYAEEAPKKGRLPVPPKMDNRTVEGWLKYKAYLEEQSSIARWRSIGDLNRSRCRRSPVYGRTLLAKLGNIRNYLLPAAVSARDPRDMLGEHFPPAAAFVHSYEERVKALQPLIDKYAVIPPNVVARDLPYHALPGFSPAVYPPILADGFDTLHEPTVKLQIAFPDSSLLQYDCGKLQKLYEMLRDLKAEGHRVLIFTQMTRVLDILEIFLSYNGHRYLRLDGSTKIEDRQVITERFNSDPRIFVFIASSRSGGVGINLTGADTVFFYDSDWNPSMDRQCMDRAHRIGQTREVHIYRFVSSHTVEENMLKKANQKRLLDRVVIQEGDFTTEFFGKMDWRDMLDDPTQADRAAQDAEGDRMEDIAVEDEPEAQDAEATAPRLGQERELAKAFAEVEDEEDVEAARVAQGEGELDFQEFTDTAKAKQPTKTPQDLDGEDAGTPAMAVEGADEEGEDEGEEDEVGGVDEYMLRLVEWDWEWFAQHY